MAQPLSTLDRAWVGAMAALPLGWELAGIERHGGPAAIVPGRPDYELPGDRTWLAWARSVDRSGSVEAYGSTPHQALDALAAKLREIRGSANG